MKFSCDACGKSDAEELHSWGPYGRTERNKKDQREYCPDCWEQEVKEQHSDNI